MFIKSFIAAAALATAVSLGSAGAAQADSGVSVGIGFGDGYGGWGGGSGAYDGGYDDGYSWRRRYDRRWDEPRPMRRGISCAEGRNIVAASGFRGVFANDCSAPVYRYTGWKRGQQFRISVSFRGNIVGVNPIY